MAEFKRNTSGFTADVEKYDETTIIKIYRDEVSDEAVEREILCTESIQGLGLPVPEYRGRTTRDGKRAILQEYIEGSNMMELLLAGELSPTEAARDFAGVHYQMHSCKAPGLESSKLRFERMLKNSQRNLGEDLTQRCLKLLYELPEGDSLCHNDFHPLNIIYSPRGMVVIDWSDATAGNPISDISKTIQAFDYGFNLPRERRTPEALERLQVVRPIVQEFVREYEREYARLSGMSTEEFVELSMPWRVVTSAARFDIEWDTNKAGLLKVFYDYFEEHPVR